MLGQNGIVSGGGYAKAASPPAPPAALIALGRAALASIANAVPYPQYVVGGLLIVAVLIVVVRNGMSRRCRWRTLLNQCSRDGRAPIPQVVDEPAIDFIHIRIQGPGRGKATVEVPTTGLSSAGELGDRLAEEMLMTLGIDDAFKLWYVDKRGESAVVDARTSLSEIVRSERVTAKVVDESTLEPTRRTRSRYDLLDSVLARPPEGADNRARRSMRTAHPARPQPQGRRNRTGW